MAGFTNPVIGGFHPDPSICRFGDEFVLVTSSFSCFPGVPVFSSPDLLSWTQVGNALDRPAQLDLSDTDGWPGLGVLAPTIRSHAGRLWLITTVARRRRPPYATFLVTADSPVGPWSDPVELDIPAIDPDLAWDDDGRCYVHTGGISRYEIDDATGRVLAGPEPTWSGSGLQHPEGPHLIRRGDYWYLLIAEGGTERGHSVSVARGRSPVGPWDPCPANPILSHRSTNRPIQNTGHADMVQAPDGTWWMVLLGVRPRGVTPGFHVLGRETFLVPVEWVDDWPVPGELSLDMPTAPLGATQPAAGADRDDFDTSALGPQWVQIRRPLAGAAALSERPGWLTLTATDTSLDSAQPVFVGRRQRDHLCQARTLVASDGARQAGLCIFMDERHHYEVALADGCVVVRARIGDLASEAARQDVRPGPVVLRLDTVEDYGGALGPAPDRVRLGFEDDGRFVVLAELDGRYLSTEVAGGFAGRLIGLYAEAGEAHFDWFELAPKTPDPA